MHTRMSYMPCVCTRVERLIVWLRGVTRGEHDECKLIYATGGSQVTDKYPVPSVPTFISCAKTIP